jgi:hypothetical protein
MPLKKFMRTEPIKMKVNVTPPHAKKIRLAISKNLFLYRC